MPAPKTTSPFSDEELLALLRDDTVSPESIAAEMVEAGVTSPPAPPVLAAARAIIRALSPEQAPAVEALPPELRTVIVDAAIAARSVDFLASLLNSRDKALCKEAKRAIHELKASGLKVEAPRPSTATSQTAAGEPQPTFMTSIDGSGRRVLFFVAPARGGMDVAQIVVSDEAGIVSADFAPLGRKEYRKFLEKLAGSGEMLAGEVPRAYARSLVTRALDLTDRTRRSVPSSFNDVAFLLGPSVGPTPSPGRTLPRPEDERVLAIRAAELLARPEFRSWLPQETDARALQARLDEITASTLYIDDAQRQASVRAHLNGMVEAFWTRQRRDLIADRLFDMAYLLHRAGRAEPAALSVASAWALASDSALESVSFAFAFFEQLLPEPQDPGAPPARDDRPGPGSLIVPG